MADLVEALRALAGGGGRPVLRRRARRRAGGHVLFTRSLLDAPRRLVDVLVLSPWARSRSTRAGASAPPWCGTPLPRLGSEPSRWCFSRDRPSYHSRLVSRRAAARVPQAVLRIPDAAFQVRTTSTYEPWMTGTLVYAEPFWRAGLRGAARHGGLISFPCWTGTVSQTVWIACSAHRTRCPRGRRGPPRSPSRPDRRRQRRGAERHRRFHLGVRVIGAEVQVQPVLHRPGVVHLHEDQAGRPSGSGRISNSSAASFTTTHPRAAVHHRPSRTGSRASTTTCSHCSAMARRYRRCGCGAARTAAAPRFT